MDARFILRAAGQVTWEDDRDARFARSLRSIAPLHMLRSYACPRHVLRPPDPLVL